MRIDNRGNASGTTRLFDWQRDLHPSMTWLNEPRTILVSVGPRSKGDLNKWAEATQPPSWWTPDRMEAAVSIFCILFAALLGYALGAR